MLVSGIVPLGIFLLIVGLIFFFAAFLILRMVPKIRPQSTETALATTETDVPAHSDAVLMVTSGGQISYINKEARSWFNLWDEEPNIEKIARRTRPEDIFLNLCAAAGQARFAIDGQWVEGTSYAVPGENGSSVLLSLRPPQVTALQGEGSAKSSQTIEILTTLGRAMAADLDMERTLQSILTSVEELIPADFVEITVWDAEKNHLIPYRFVGLQGLDLHLEQTSDRYQLGQGYSGYVAESREPLLVPDVEEHQELQPIIDRRKYPFHAYLGIPLLVGGDLVGTLELTSLSVNAFGQDDLELLSLLSGQAAIALHNALLYEEEQRRSLEMTNLASLTEAVTTVRDSKELFEHLVQGISPLLDAEIVGFLIFNETNRKLQAQQPFIGVPPQFVDMYQIAISTGTPAERVWNRHGIINAAQATDDERLVSLGLDHMARAAGITSTVLYPLSSGGRMLGYLQVANKKGETAFDADDVRLLSIIAGQAAPIIENADLIQQSVRRALRAESLRRVASLSGSTASLDEILKYSLLELARLFQSDYGLIFLYDVNVGELQAHSESAFGIEPDWLQDHGKINANDPDFRFTVTQSKESFISTNTDEDGRIPTLYEPFIRSLGVKSLIDVPIIIRDRGLGEVVLGSQQTEFFTHSDIQLAITVASQLSIAIERATLASQTDVDLRKRVDQLTALTRISRELNTSIDLNHLLQRVYEEAIQTTSANCGSIMLFDFIQEVPTNGVSSGESASDVQVLTYFGEKPGERLHPLEVQALESGRPVIVDDFSNHANGQDPEIWYPSHAGIQAALIAPIAYQESTAGLIHLHSNSAGTFDHAALEIVQALAVQAAIAIGNAQRYQEQVNRTSQFSQRVETLSNIFETSQKLHLEQPLEETLEEIAYAIQLSTPFHIVLISLYEPADQCLHRITGAGIPLTTMDDLKERPQAWEDIHSLLDEQFRFGRSYYIPHDQRPAMPESFHSVTMGENDNNDEAPAITSWHPQDLLIIPLTKLDDTPLGLISIDNPSDNRRPSESSIETLEIFASQAALIIESHQRLASLESELADVNQELIEHSEASQQLPGLLETERQQNQLVEQLEYNVTQVTAVLNIIENVHQQADRGGILTALAQEMNKRMDMDTVLIAETGPSGPQLLHIEGTIPEGAQPEALMGRRNPLHQSLQSDGLILASDLKTDSEWTASPLLTALETASFISLPISSNLGQEAALLGIRQAGTAPFSEENRPIFELITRQVASAINNLNLITETGQRLREVNLLLEFSQQIGNLEPAHILQTLIDSAFEVVPSAETGLVTMWDTENNALLPEACRGYSNEESIQKIRFPIEESLLGEVLKTGEPARIDDVDFASHYHLVLDNLMSYQDATGGKLPISSMVLPIKASDISLGVLTIDNYSAGAAFTPEDQALVESLARQTALNLENVRLYQATEERATQLQALSDVATTITSRLEPEILIDSLLDSLTPVVPYNTGTLWLRDEDTLTIQSARGFENSDLLVGISTSVEDSRLFHEMIETSKPISVEDVRQDERFPAAEAERLSWLGVPLLAKGEVIGVLALEKNEVGYYTYETVNAATTFASQAAVALENATLYQQSLRRASELDKRTQRLDLLNRFSNQISSTLDTGFLLEVTLKEISQAIPDTSVSAVRWNNEIAEISAELPEVYPSYPQVVPSAPIFDRLGETLGIFSTQDIDRETDIAPLNELLAKHNTKSLLILPLAVGEQLYGFILVHAETSRRFTVDETELGRIITNQAAVALQNASLFAETRRLTEELEQRVAERTEQLGREHQRTQTLLRIMQELSASLDLDHVLNRTLALLNETTGAQQSTILLVRPNEQNFYYRASLGYTTPPPTGGRPSTIPLDEGLAGWIINNREGALIDDLLEDPRWIKQRDVETEHRSAIATPLMVGAEALGSMLLFHRETQSFSPEHRELVQAAANQIAIAINNAELFNLIREQAESLGGMLRTQQVEASRSMAILEAVADGVLVTDADSTITLFNESAQQILNLDRETVVGQSLDDFTGFFGGAAQSWWDTIRLWSTDSSTFGVGDTYAERITLDNKRVVSIHLAPVVMRNEFLGTVSIFRDITHQVEVDRLKSEFVATVSHELRTPMTSIKGYVEILLMGAAGALSDQQASFLEIVKGNTERLNILVNDLLDVSRIEAGKVTLSIQPLYLGEIASDVIKEQLRQAEEDQKTILIDLQVEEDLPHVPGDIERVRQIIGNIINNAYYYTPAGGEIKVSIYSAENEVQVDVKDNGIGITPEEQQRIFERFFRGEDPMVLATAGTGLGLSITQQLIEMHHGQIWMESRGVPGDGSLFSFTLPIQAPEDEEADLIM